MPSSKDHAYPLGYSAEFIVYLHDNIGRHFCYANIPLSHRLSRSDIVSVSPESGNSTYKIKASKKGNTILKVWTASQTHISDYIRIRVDYAILPSLATVHLGCSVCFTTHLTEESGGGWSGGVWSVGERGVLQIESNSGVGVAKSTGRAVVYHSSHSTVDTHTEITVSRVNRVGLPLTSLPSFTNARQKPELGLYKIPIQFYHSGSETFTRLLISPACRNISSSNGTYLQQVPFECQLELKTGTNNLLLADKFIAAKSTFDPDTGASYCVLGPAGDVGVAETIATDDGLSLSLKVKVDSYHFISPCLKVPFVPAFVLNREEVRLGQGETSAVVKVTGLPQQLQGLKVSCVCVNVHSRLFFSRSFLPSHLNRVIMCTACQSNEALLLCNIVCQFSYCERLCCVLLLSTRLSQDLLETYCLSLFHIFLPHTFHTPHRL